ncbi:MAG: J domain-containing protein [Alphaproteobacteria bacterium]|nr:J domain-containing protein [Alphaproteobacteria bacterium]
MTASRAYNPRYIPPLERTVRPPGVCAWPGCAGVANYPAPRSPNDLRDYLHFCLDHVRAYNSGWNFFAGMSGDEIDAFRHEDITGHRPTWRIGPQPDIAYLRRKSCDPFGFMGGGPGGGERPAQRPSADERNALETMGFEAPVPPAELKARFKALVKRFHPDANGGDERAGERLRLIIHAYRLLVGRKRETED